MTKPTKPSFVRVIPAHDSEILEVHWTLTDGGRYDQRLTCPPAVTRERQKVNWFEALMDGKLDPPDHSGILPPILTPAERLHRLRKGLPL